MSKFRCHMTRPSSARRQTPCHLRKITTFPPHRKRGPRRIKPETLPTAPAQPTREQPAPQRPVPAVGMPRHLASVGSGRRR